MLLATGMLVAGGLTDAAFAQDAPPICPVFVSAGDPAYCQANPGLMASAETLPEIVPLSYDPERGLRLVSRRPLFGPGEISLLGRDYGPAPANPYGTREEKISVYRDEAAALQPGSMNSSYDLPIFDGVALSNSSAVSQGPAAPGDDITAKSFNSKFGLAYEEYGLTFRVNPDAAINWGSLAGSGNRRVGIDNQISAMLARDLTLTLSSGYDTTAYLGDPNADMDTERHSIAIAQHFQSGYKLGISAQRRNEIGVQQERDLNILGLMVGVPLGESLNLTANHEFGLTQKYDLQASNAVPLAGTQQMLDLQLHWTPALLASRAMTIMAGYMVSRQDESGVADPYLSQARLNLAMRF